MKLTDSFEKKGALHVRSFALSLAILAALFAIIISSWSRSTGFATDFWMMYHSLHSTQFGLDMSDPTAMKHIIGTIIDVAYAFVDGLILGAFWGGLYNFMLPFPKEKQADTVSEEE